MLRAALLALSLCAAAAVAVPKPYGELTNSFPPQTPRFPTYFYFSSTDLPSLPAGCPLVCIWSSDCADCSIGSDCYVPEGSYSGICAPAATEIASRKTFVSQKSFLNTKEKPDLHEKHKLSKNIST